MEFIINYWYIILAAVVAAAVGIVMIVQFFRQPRGKQLNKVQEWLLWAVIEAERKFGDHMGQVQLRFVYDLFVSKFTWLARIISFEMFCDLVDKALAKMKKLLTENEALADYVAGVN